MEAYTNHYFNLMDLDKISKPCMCLKTLITNIFKF